MRFDVRCSMFDVRWLVIAVAVAILCGCWQSDSSGDQKSELRDQKSEVRDQASVLTSDLRSPSSKPFHFTDVTATSGINMVITCGQSPATEIIEVNGGGLALIDFDNDGRLDLFVANGATMANPEHGPGSRLFRNISSPPPNQRIQFEDVTESSGIHITRWATAAAVGDFDGDGFDDIYITCYGPNILLHNNGDGTFTNVTAQAIGEPPTVGRYPEWSTGAAFADLDGDGDLDLYVCNYLEFDINNPPRPRSQYKGIDVMAGPHGLRPQHDVLYENLFSSGASAAEHEHSLNTYFRDVSETSGIRNVPPSFGLNVVMVDFDGDGAPDITVANDSMPDFLFHNKTDRQQATSMAFEEIGIISGLASNRDGSNQASMGLAIADVNGDGLPDKFTTVFSSDVNALHVQMAHTRGALLFEDRAQQFGLAMISRPYLGWSAGFFDFDHDGHEDLFFVNGHVYPQATLETMDSEYAQPPLMFRRDGQRFVRVRPEDGGAWLSAKHHDRNAVFADLDGDGDIDIIIGELNGPIRVLQNTLSDASASNARWLIVELKDSRPDSRNHRGLGSKIELRHASNQHNESPVHTRWILTGGGFQSSGAHYAHFGLGRSLEGGEGVGVSALNLTIIWPDGYRQLVADVQPNQHLIVRRE